MADYIPAVEFRHITASGVDKLGFTEAMAYTSE